MIDARGNSAAGVGAGMSEQDINAILANYGTKEWVDENYLSIEWFNSLFNAVDSNGDPILPNDGNTSNIDSIKAMFGFWTEQYISALGQGNDGGGGGAGDVTWALLADSNDTRPIALSHLTTALATYATQSWVQSQGYATLAQFNALEYLATVTNGEGCITLTTNKNTNYIVDLTHEHSWFDIQDRPTTLADYGVKDELDTILSGYLPTSSLKSLTFYGDGNTIGTYLPTAAMTVDFVSGTNISISRDATNHKLTINNTYQHPTGGADTTILSQDGRVLSSISVNAFGHVTSVGYKTLSMADMPAAMKYFNTITTTGDGSLTFIGYNTPDAVVDLTHQHSWFEIQDRPTSLAEFGITVDDPLLKDNYLTIEFFSALFKAYAGTTEVRPNGSTSTVDNIKAMFGFWTAQYLSALGLGADGQAGTFDESQMWQALGTDSSSKQISAAYLTNATRYNAITIANGGITFSGVGVTNTTVDLTHDHCFGELKATPDSLAGYGITDAYILGTKIYLGNQSIDVSGGQVDLSGYATQSWVQTYYQPVGNYLTSASLDGFVSRSGSAMYTDAVISRTGSSVMWVQGRSYPIIKTVSYTGYNAILSMKTTNGSWDLGVYSDNTAYLTYITDTDYNNINNNVTYQLTFPKTIGTLATQEWVSGRGYLTSLSDSFRYIGGVSDAYVNGTTYSTLSNGEYIWQRSGYSESMLHFQVGGSASGLDIRFHYLQDSGNPLYYRKTVDSNRFAATSWVALIDSQNIGSQSVNYANSAGNADTVDGYHVSSLLPKSGGTMTGTLNVATGLGISDATGNGLLVYHPSGWTGVSNTQWGVGAIDCVGVIRSSDSALKHYRDGSGTYDIIDSKGGQTISNSLQIASVEIGNTNEINATGSNTLYLQYRNTGNLCLCYNGYNVGIGTASPSYKLHVAGSIYATGGVTALSDARRKSILSYINLDVEKIASMRDVRFVWSDGDPDKDVHVGTIAQDWQSILPEVVSECKDTWRTLSMDYSAAALVSVIATARKVVDHETRIRKLEQENEELRKQISQLKAA